MCAAELPVLDARPLDRVRYGRIVVVGGGCYGSYYVRQLARARRAGKLTWDRLTVVDRDSACRVAGDRELAAIDGLELVNATWRDFFARYLAEAESSQHGAGLDAVVPSPLMPHLMFEWLLERARARWPARTVALTPLESAPPTPWQRANPDGTHVASFAEWMCPINCVEPAKCPATRDLRHWSMPSAVAAYAEAERAAGRLLDGAFAFHCAHRAYGVGMFDTADVVAADREIARIAAEGPAAFVVATVSHCHGVWNRMTVGGP